RDEDVEFAADVPSQPQIPQNRLFQNRPNPFNPETIIPYSVAAKGKVTIGIYDISGRCIRTLVDAVKDPGIYQTRWTGELDSGGKAASSIYFYRITYPDGASLAKKMALLR
ncbi:MAG: T9SS type A sorting domain-containing protein, partial [Candidatus Eisenbacteria bacterium]